MDELTALFANKPTSFLGAGLIFNGDASGNGVSSTEQDVVVVQRFNQNDEAGEFKGMWYPTRGAAITNLNVTGGTLYDGVTVHTIAAASLTVHASSLNYVYLSCGLTKATVDGWVSGGTVDATPTIATATSFPANTNTAGYIPLFTWQAGALAAARGAYFPFVCELLQKRSGSAGDVTFNWLG
jgi:hypothetical protein